MTDVLDGVLDDLRVGLSRRADRRRRVRAATATVLSSVAVAVAAVGAVGVAGERAPVSATHSTVAGRLITGEDCAALGCRLAGTRLNLDNGPAVAAP